MDEDIPEIALRLPRGLHDKIQEFADKSGRSMNAEIVYRLGQSFLYASEGQDQIGIDELQERIAFIAQKHLARLTLQEGVDDSEMFKLLEDQLKTLKKL